MKSHLIASLGIISCLILMSANEKVAEPSLTIHIYYEIKNDKSLYFFEKQLLPFYSYVKDIVRLELVPYQEPLYVEKQKKPLCPERKDNSEFQCPIGLSDCSEGELHACTIAQLNSLQDERSDEIPSFIRYLQCLIVANYTDDILYQCAYIMGLKHPNVEGIAFCVKSDLGKFLLSKFNNEMRILRPTIILNPTIVVNETYSRENHIIGRKNFFHLICKSLTSRYRPSKCYDYQEKS
ncbi:gamma-interferon-inducible lysosomal thiol reductase-like isoform X2 [Prorops nasuta]|uniref:gamma-interferon-inducible lysosomal thiol reductase-like isoform X2 n=1 Tax=Prorops nasuta TaxID=863751 RepID=UPI0034CD2C0F